MNFANVEGIEDGEPLLPDIITDLVQNIHPTFALWCDDSHFASTIRDYLLFITPVLQYDHIIDLGVIPQAVILFVFRSFPLANLPQFNKQLNAKNRVIFLSMERNISLVVGSEEWPDGLSRYRHSRFLWVIMKGHHSNLVNVFAFPNSKREELSEIGKEEGLKLFQEFKPSNPTIPNFHGQEIVVTTKNTSIFSYMEPLYNGSTQYSWNVDGFQLLLLTSALKRINVTIAYRGNPRYGMVLKNGSITTGLLKDVVEQVTDISTGHIFLRPELMGLAEISNPWEHVCVRYLVPRPVLLNSSSLVLVNVFHLDTYLLILTAILATSAVATFIARVGRCSFHRNYRTFALSVFGMVLQLAQVQHPTRCEYRKAFMPLLLCWGWLGFLLTLIYNAELSATFTKPIFSAKIQNERQFLEQGYTWGSCRELQKDKASDLGLFFDMSDPVVNKWANGYCADREDDEVTLREQLMMTGSHVILGMSYGKLAYYRELTGPARELVKKYEAADQCALQKVVATIFAPGSPYVEAVNLISSRLLAGGISQKDEYDLAWGRPRSRSHIPQNVFTFTRDIRQEIGFSSVPLSVFYGPFIFLMSGWVISTVTFLYERKTFKRPAENVDNVPYVYPFLQ